MEHCGSPFLPHMAQICHSRRLWQSLSGRLEEPLCNQVVLLGPVCGPWQGDPAHAQLLNINLSWCFRVRPHTSCQQYGRRYLYRSIATARPSQDLLPAERGSTSMPRHEWHTSPATVCWWEEQVLPGNGLLGSDLSKHTIVVVTRATSAVAQSRKAKASGRSADKSRPRT